ncbi:phage antirepressor N-terminal domain-containing protein [Vreelandella aquamarina]|uniref:phage antirepressor N-terminal domain-containing protein n=1 Tax=Vreelandella aquamarina TaxID=77097 RepID=UPI0007807B90|nr:phage antirepressor N-terminal domain-containing protein [Halomonas axialensis]
MNDSSTGVVTVPFNGNDLYLIEHEGQPYTPMKPIVDGMGLDWRGQQAKIKANQRRWATMEISSIVAADGKKRSMICIPLRKLPGWLMTIMPNKVKNPAIREKVEQYQDECDDVLWSYWTKGVAINPRIPLTPDHQRGIQKAVARRAQALPKGLQRLAYSRLYSHLKDRFDVAKYDQIPDEQYTQALAAIETCELEGEWMPAPEESTSRLDIHYPLERWSEINSGLAYAWKHQPPLGCKGRQARFVWPEHVSGDPAHSVSPTLMLLGELVAAGYDVGACRAEVQAMRSMLDDLSSVHSRIQEALGRQISYPVIFSH